MTSVCAPIAAGISMLNITESDESAVRAFTARRSASRKVAGMIPQAPACSFCWGGTALVTEPRPLCAPCCRDFSVDGPA